MCTKSPQTTVTDFGKISILHAWESEHDIKFILELDLMNTDKDT